MSSFCVIIIIIIITITVFTSKAVVNRIYVKKQGRREEVWEAENVG
jgi:hypothetical protein